MTGQRVTSLVLHVTSCINLPFYKSQANVNSSHSVFNSHTPDKKWLLAKLHRTLCHTLLGIINKVQMFLSLVAHDRIQRMLCWTEPTRCISELSSCLGPPAEDPQGCLKCSTSRARLMLTVQFSQTPKIRQSMCQCLQLQKRMEQSILLIIKREKKPHRKREVLEQQSGKHRSLSVN